MNRKSINEKKWHLVFTLIFWFLIGFIFGCISNKPQMICKDMPTDTIKIK